MKIGRMYPLIVFFGFFSSPVGVGAFDDPKKTNKQTDRRGRRSLQGFVIPPVCLLWFLFFSVGVGAFDDPKKPSKQTDRRGRLSLQGFVIPTCLLSLDPFLLP